MWVVSRSNAYALVILFAVAAMPAVLIERTSYGVVGVVGAVTLPPVALGEYLSLQEGERSVPGIALTRGYDIIIGAYSTHLRGLSSQLL